VAIGGRYRGVRMAFLRRPKWEQGRLPWLAFLGRRRFFAMGRKA
jgi:hypothetical protein